MDHDMLSKRRDVLSYCHAYEKQIFIWFCQYMIMWAKRDSTLLQWQFVTASPSPPACAAPRPAQHHLKPHHQRSQRHQPRCLRYFLKAPQHNWVGI